MPPAHSTSPTGNAERLRGAIELLLRGLVKESERLLDHPRVRDLYPEYLFMGHCVIRASVPLMETARERALSMAPSDPVAAELAGYLGEHIDEERHHDEWLLDDLVAIGVERAGVVARPPSATVASAVGAQYYWILHYHPVALLGWIGLLEGYPPWPETIDRLMARTGYGPEAFRTLIAHAELDPHHGDELFEALDRMSLTAEQSAAIGLNGMSSVHLLAKALHEVTGRVPVDSPGTRA